MTRTSVGFERALKLVFRLHTSAVDEIDLWPRVQRELARSARPRARRRRALLVALAAAALVTGGAAAARVLVGISGGPGQPTMLTPAPDFQVLEPSYLPAGLDVHQIGYYPGPGAGEQRPMAVAGRPMRRQGSTFVPVGRPLDTDRLAAMAQAHVPALLEGWSSASGSEYVEILEHRAGSGPATPVGDQEGRTVITVTVHGTLVEVTTNLGRDEATRVAASLEVRASP